MIPNYFMMQQQGLIWVQGLDAAKSYMVAPNNTVTLWDANEPVIYLKTADAVGMPSIKIIDYTVREQATKSLDAVTGDLVTKDDILSIKKEIEDLKAKIAPKSTKGKEVAANE